MSSSSNQDDFVCRVIDAQRRLNAYILTLVANPADAADVLQETNAVLLRKRDEYTAGTGFWPWACKVAYFEALAYHRRKQRDRLSFGFDEALLETISQEVGPRAASMDDQLSALGRCIERLSDRDRELLHLRYREDRDASQIASLVGRTVRAVYQVLYRIRGDLTRCVQHAMTARE